MHFSLVAAIINKANRNQAGQRIKAKQKLQREPSVAGRTEKSKVRGGEVSTIRDYGGKEPFGAILQAPPIQDPSA